MEILTVKSRVDHRITGTWAGRQYDLEPFASGAFPSDVATAMKRQNPIMGSGDPRNSDSGMTGRMKYKVGIVEYNDPTDPIATNPQAVERWDRTKLVGAKPSDVVAGDNGLYSRFDATSAPLPLDPTIMSTSGDT